MGSGSLSVDWWVINDGASAGVPELVRGRALARPERVKVFLDHDAPCGSVESAQAQKSLIAFALDNGCELFNGRGVSHQIMLDRFVAAGEVVAGCLSFPAMYGAVNALAVGLTPEALADSLCGGEAAVEKAETIVVRLEGSFAAEASAKDAALRLRATGRLAGKRAVFAGSGAAALSRSGRIALCQGVDALFAAFATDCGGGADADLVLDLSSVKPMVAGPHMPDRVRDAAELAGTRIDEVFVGGCSGGRLEDLRAAAEVLAGKRVPARVRLMVAPATSEIYAQAADEGVLAALLDAGALLMNQGCSVCWGSSQGIVEAGEVLLSAGSRNGCGCAGATGAEVYLCSPAVAARSALAGCVWGGED